MHLPIKPNEVILRTLQTNSISTGSSKVKKFVNISGYTAKIMLTGIDRIKTCLIDLLTMNSIDS